MAHNQLKILIRADGSKEIGMGHIYRNLRLARFLKKHYGITSVFVTHDHSACRALLKKEKIQVRTIGLDSSLDDEKRKLKAIVADEQPVAVIVDLLKDCFDSSYMSSFRWNKTVKLVAFLDAYRYKKVDADIIFNTSPLNGYRGKAKYYSGFKYLILPEEYGSIKLLPKVKAQVRNVMLCMGGSDHNNLTYRVLKAIDRSGLDFECDVAVSSAYFSKKDMDAQIKPLKHRIRVHYDANGLLKILKKSDVAVTAGGYSQVERMAAGVPGLVISQVEHQEKYSQQIHKSGGCVHLGFHKDISDEDILNGFENLLNDSKKRRDIARSGRKLVDGRGLNRIADIVARVISTRKEDV